MTTMRQVRVKRIDWFRVLADLRDRGLTIRVITACTAISKPTLLDLRNQDADPKTHQGELLIALWMRTTGKSHDQLPRHGDPCNGLKRRYVESWERGTIHCPLCGTKHAVKPPKGIRHKPKPPPAPEPVDDRQLSLLC